MVAEGGSPFKAVIPKCCKKQKGPLATLWKKCKQNKTCLIIFDNFENILTAKMWEIYFQNGGGMIMLLGAPAKSKFDGLSSENIDVHDFPIFGTPGNPYLWI